MSCSGLRSGDEGLSSTGSLDVAAAGLAEVAGLEGAASSEEPKPSASISPASPSEPAPVIALAASARFLAEPSSGVSYGLTRSPPSRAGRSRMFLEALLRRRLPEPAS